WSTRVRRTSGRASTSRPPAKNVACTPSASRAERTSWAVAASGTPSKVTATWGTAREPWLITEPNHSALAEVAPTQEAVSPVVRTTTLVRAHDTRRRTTLRAEAGTGRPRLRPAARGPRLVVT